MKTILQAFTTRPRLVLALAVGLLAAAVAPGEIHPITRSLIGWNVGVWLYLALVGWMMFRADQSHVRRVAVAHGDGAAVVLIVVVGAVVASMVAILAELAHTGPSTHASQAGRLLFTGATVIGSWLLLPMEFTLQYASQFYGDPPDGGLKFPDADPHFKPEYIDFVYFALTISVACQTADVVVTERPMRKLVLLQSVLSFVFNTAILALSVNVAASLVH